MTESICEQIEFLRQFNRPGFDGCADTMERLLAVYEAAKLTVNHADFWDRDELIPALAALGEDDV